MRYTLTNRLFDDFFGSLDYDYQERDEDYNIELNFAGVDKKNIDVSVDGGIRSIRVTDCGSGFTELPEISINTETGYNAILKPIMKFHRPGEIDVPKGTSVIQVVDCVGKVV